MAKPSIKKEVPKYNPSEIEVKWQAYWEKNKTYQPDLGTAKKPFYNLMMFPYPSAEGLHVGSFFTYAGVDAYGRFKRMQGYDVFEPIGLDGFGIHSENFAIKIGRTPKEHAQISEKNFYKQLHAIGNGFAWDNKVETYDPQYYKWTQWIFTQLFKAGLAYRKNASVNFCPQDKTVLSDEQVIGGKCERCGTEVVKKDLEQWFFKITDYADRLLNNIDKLDWTEKVKIAQRQWIGKSEGALVMFKVKDSKEEIEVFTTRPDTLFGATFMVLAPEHPLSKKVEEKNKEVTDYIQKSQKISEQDRIAEGKEKTGVDSGLRAINPVNGEEIPIWIADYVLMGYGTGAIMAVPAHDARDFEFAKKYELPVVQVIAKDKAPIRSYLMGGENISESDLNNLGIKVLNTTKEGYRSLDIPKDKINEYEKLIEAKMTSGFWNEYISRDIVFIFKFKDGKIKRLVLNKENEEEVDRLGEEFNGRVWNKKSSAWRWLAKNDTYTDLIVHAEPGRIINSGEWNGIEVPKEIGKTIDWLEKKEIGKRQVQYHLRDWLISRQRYWGPPIPMINCPKCGWQAVPDKELPVLLPEVKDWKPKGDGKSPLASIDSFVNVNCPNCNGPAKRETDVSDTFLDSAWYFFRYISTEFNDKVFDKKRADKWLPVDMYIGGAEHSVLHLLYSRFITMVFKDLKLIDFEEPFTKFRANGLIIKDGAKMSKSKGNVINPDDYVRKFGADALRLYLAFVGPFTQGGDFSDTGIEGMYRFVKRIWTLAHLAEISRETSKEGLKWIHKTIKKVTEDMENLRFNTAIASIMEYYNFLVKQQTISKDQIKTLIILISPLAPHVSEELWELMGEKSSVHKVPWPVFSEEFLVENTTNVIVQINGRTRDVISVNSSDIYDQQLVEETAKKSQKVEKYMINSPIRKVVYVPGKIISFVVDDGSTTAS